MRGPQKTHTHLSSSEPMKIITVQSRSNQLPEPLQSNPRRSSSLPQAAAFFALLLLVASSFPAHAADKITAKTGVVTTGKILGVKGGSVEVQMDIGKIGVRLDTIKTVEMAEPPEFATAMKLMQEGNGAKALASLEKLVTTYRGLPTPWASQASSALGLALIDAGRLDDAAKAFEEFSKAYPDAGGSVEATVGKARVDLEKNNIDQARGALTPLAERALASFEYSATDARVFSNVFLLLGRIEEQSGNKPGALQNYLRTINIFPADKVAVADAEKRVDGLKDVVVP